MIPLLSLAHAVTPTELEAAVPAARQQLATCTREGCLPREGAKAAYLLAVHNYTSEGVADGGLVATVRLLDPALYASFPPVLKEAATWPAAWALASDLSPDRELKERLLQHPDPGPYEADPKLPYGSMTVVAVDAETGAPVPGFVRFRDEDELHRMHVLDGRWTGSARYLPDGSERYFQKGDVLQLYVSAPGYSYQKVSVVLGKRKANYFQVQLQRWEPADDGSPEGSRAIAAHRAWVEAEKVALKDWSEESYQRVVEARVTAAGLARGWLDAGGGADAKLVCLHTGTPLFCE